MRTTLFRFVAFFLLLTLFVGLTPPAFASTFTVTNLNDVGAGSLSAAITAAGSGDAIDFVVSGTITLESQLPAIDKTLTIDGSTAPGSITIARDTLASDFGLIQVTSSGNLTLKDLTLSDGSSSTGGAIENAGTLSINDSTFSNNSAPIGKGGAVSNLGTATINRSSFSENTADLGGALYNNGTMTVTDSTISNNTVLHRGNGSGIDNLGILTVIKSNISNNMDIGGIGGGISSFNNTSFPPTLTVSNSTFYGNLAGYGAGIFTGGTMTITNSTITGNSTYNGIYPYASGAGLATNGAFPTTIGSTIIAGNMSLLNADVVGAFTTLGYNAFGDMSGATFTPDPTDLTDAAATPLNLGALADNGGPTQTMALGAGSVAIGAGNCSTLAGVDPVTTDQRGIARKSSCDIGAYETQPNPPPPPPPNTTPEPSSGGAVTALCSAIDAVSNGAVTGSGGIGNVQANGQTGNTYCRLIAQDGSYSTSPAEIGVQSVIDLGVVQAVNVFGELPDGATVVPFASPVTICLLGSGDVLFLSAADPGRTPQNLPATISGGYRCVSVPNSGTVVLVGTVSTIPVQTSASGSPAQTALTDCQVTTTDSPLNLRSAANTSASVIAKLPYQLTLKATAHVAGWYQVVYMDGQGWISDQFVSTVGDCG